MLRLASAPFSAAAATLNVCYFGTYSAGPGYPVNRVLIEGLRRVGATVWECNAPLSEGNAAVERWKSARGPLARVGLALRWAWAWVRLVARWIGGPRTDLVIVGYLGHLDVLLARVITRRPVVLNALFSLHDTVVRDRRLIPERSLGARVLWRVDRLACRVADLVLLDTRAHIDHFGKEFQLPPDRFHRVLVGSDRAAKPLPTRRPGEPCRVLFVGTFIPLHGATTILDAVERLSGQRSSVVLRLIGQGQEFSAVAERVRQQGLSGVELVDRWIGDRDYEAELANADICLGIFGATAKAQRVIPSKVYDALAAGRPVITADTPAARELLTHGKDAWLCPAADGAALADAVMTLVNDDSLRQRLAQGARATYEARCSPEAIGRDVMTRLEGLVKNGRG